MAAEDPVHVQDDAQATTRSCLRILRQRLDTGLPLLGVVVILSAVLFMPEFPGQVAIVILGMLLSSPITSFPASASTWRSGTRPMGSSRWYATSMPQP